jgi:hypothetical protein
MSTFNFRISTKDLKHEFTNYENIMSSVVNLNVQNYEEMGYELGALILLENSMSKIKSTFGFSEVSTVVVDGHLGKVYEEYYEFIQTKVGNSIDFRWVSSFQPN